MRKAFSFLAGMVMGGLVGATLALLLAPTSGQALREQMRSRAEGIRLEVHQAADARREELERQLAELRAPRKSEQA